MTAPKLAVWKLTSCDGCQLAILDCEDELLTLARAVHIAHFLEMSSATAAGPYDISIVEGSVTTPADARRVERIRESSRVLVTVGACATAGGIQSLRNFAEPGAYRAAVYAHPDYISSLDESIPVSSLVEVDTELHGCPVDRHQLLEVIAAHLAGRRSRLPRYPVCQECKARGAVCVLVARDVACLGPVTSAGCGALCPSVHRGCYGCFGPAADANTRSLAARLRGAGMTAEQLVPFFRNFNAQAPEFLAEAAAQEEQG